MDQVTVKDGADAAAETPRKAFVYKNGRIYFSKATERKLFFVLTFCMLAAGILAKMGLW